ncbi:flagellar biosynthesis protein FlhB [Pelagibacterium xiamenense]|uniref:flagellar biosynthesis protein FlhB n=1 Tax=Pelagibacterium xiamenense TaxID=2901140 RepID=UPI001E63DF5C|nr:flagellar biosynthesis protein FlhB [Pelagibacterium xiamenense]MCD7059990.1 flagellar biosynthesis protein FlhB [Pelagibacterium xiamenense]
MSDQPEQSEKTEDPSQKRIEDAHKKGDVVKSQEVTTWFMIMGSALVFAFVAPMTSQSVMESLGGIIAQADQFEVGGPAFGQVMQAITVAVLGALIIPMVLMALFGIAGNIVQHQMVFSTEPLKPKLSKVSPVSGAKRLFSTEALVNFAKGLFKLVVFSTVMFLVVWPHRDNLEAMTRADPVVILEFFQEIGIQLFIATLITITIVALLDYMYMRHKWWKRQMMTVKEVKDEYKQMEGDPHVKGRIRQVRLERSRKRMMAAVPDATVVVTNPTHFAVALKYDRAMPAPEVVAKGVDAIALRIRGLAKDHDIPIVENPPLARALYAGAEVGEQIPAEHFKAVAQIIGYVMRLKSRKGWRST